MKLRILQHDESMFRGETLDGRPRHFRNYSDHRHQRSREYVRALNAVKLEKIFAKPFVCAFPESTDSVNRLARAHLNVRLCFTGTCDGEVRVYDLNTRKSERCFSYVHSGFVSGLVSSTGDRFLFSSGDRTICQFDLQKEEKSLIQTFESKNGICNDLDHHWDENLFAISSTTLDIYSYERSNPLHSFDFKDELGKILCCRFSPVERCLLASSGQDDHGISFYDVRQGSAIRKIVLRMRTNRLTWNPRNPYHILAANEDCNLYTFDFRNLEKAWQIHSDHAMAVVDVDYSPCGSQFVSGSWDQTLRLWESGNSRSRDVYHTKRMQRLLSCCFSADMRYVMSGSEDGNLRLWKAFSSDKIGKLSHSEAAAKHYRDRLKEQWKSLDEIRKIQTYHHIPKWLYHKRHERRAVKEKMRRKEEHVLENTKDGERISSKTKAVLGEVD